MIVRGVGARISWRRAPALIRWVKEVAPAEPLDDPVKGGGGVSVDGG